MHDCMNNTGAIYVHRPKISAYTVVYVGYRLHNFVSVTGLSSYSMRLDNTRLISLLGIKLGKCDRNNCAIRVSIVGYRPIGLRLIKIERQWQHALHDGTLSVQPMALVQPSSIPGLSMFDTGSLA